MRKQIISNAYTTERVAILLPLENSVQELLWSLQNAIEWFICNGVNSYKGIVNIVEEYDEENMSIVIIGNVPAAGFLIPKNSKMVDLTKIGFIPKKSSKIKKEIRMNKNNYYKLIAEDCLNETVSDFSQGMSNLIYLLIKNGSKRFVQQSSVELFEIWGDNVGVYIPSIKENDNENNIINKNLSIKEAFELNMN